MELNWELCRIFYQVARCRNFSRAAAMLFTSQPAVSRSMAALERELGCRLFIRNRRGVELTPEGRMFYAHVEAGCEQFRRGREELEQAVEAQLELVQKGMYEKAKKNLEEHIFEAHSIEEAKELQQKNGGFIKTMWCGDEACELKMKEVAGMSSRCMPLKQEHLGDTCACCGKPAKHMIYWGVAY